MIYDNSKVRRQDRLLSEKEALELLEKGEYGFLSLSVNTTDNIYSYGIPMNYVFAANSIYYHCATEGKKIEIINRNRSASFCVVGRTALQSSKFTTQYESVLVFGEIAVVEKDEEKMDALKLILQKYSPDYIATGLKYAEKSFEKTKILKLQISSFSGKAKKTI